MTVALVALVAAVLASIVLWRAWRGVHHQLGRVADQLESEPTSADEIVEYLERAADHAHVEATAAEIRRDRLEAALAEVSDAVVVVDAEGVTTFANEPAQRFLRARHADVLAEQAMSDLLEQAVQGDAGERELQLFGPPKEMLHIRAVPLRDGAGVVGAVAFVRDVSEARRTDSVRRDFVANVSHELKTPIGALALLAETMAVGNDTAVMQQLAERVLREADRLGRIVDDLLDLSLIEAQEAPSRQPVPAELLISEAVERVRAAAEANGAPLVVAEPTPDLMLVCDQRQVVSAITNLLDNAVKYSEGDQPVEVSAISERGRLVITVRDRGVGIPARDLERIFERFYRVDRARSRATGGTGLGLAIVRHVAHAHGGDVEVQSIEGEGSTFRLLLPLAATTGQVIGLHSRTERAYPGATEPMKGVS